MKLRTFFASLWIWPVVAFLSVDPAFANSIPTHTPDTFMKKLLDLVQNVAMPLGSIIFFACIIVAGIQLMWFRNRPDARADTVAGLGYVLLGGIILGAALFLAGALIGVGKHFGS